MTAAFEILSIDLEKKRIGVKMLRDAHEADDVQDTASGRMRTRGRVWDRSATSCVVRSARARK